MDIAEKRAHEIVAEFLNSTAEVVRNAQDAIVVFYAATGILNEAAVRAPIDASPDP